MSEADNKQPLTEEQMKKVLENPILDSMDSGPLTEEDKEFFMQCAKEGLTEDEIAQKIREEHENKEKSRTGDSKA